MGDVSVLLKRDCKKSDGGGDRCYEIKSSEEEGRHMVAARDIQKGEVIMEEMPVSVGPNHYSAPVCLGCYKHVDGTVICKHCGFPICSKVNK